jgi:hypothetical protein
MAQRQIPGGPFVNETGTRQAQIPGGAFVNETVSTGHSLSGANSTQANTSGTAGIIQAHAFAEASSIQANAGSTGAITLSAVNDLVAANAAQADVSSVAAIDQPHVLAVSASMQVNPSIAVAVTQVHVLAGAASTQANPGEASAMSLSSGNLAAAPSMQVNPGGTGVIAQIGTVLEPGLMTGMDRIIRVKKPGIPAGTPEWLKTLLEIVIGRRGNAIGVPEFQALTFSASPTKAECEALYAYTNEIRTAVENILARLDS